MRRVQRPRPDGVLAAADLGVRVELGQLRRALPGAGPAAPAQAAPADLGGGGVLRPHLLHRLPDAGRPGPHPAGRQRARVGRRRRPGHVRGAAVRAARRKRDRRRLVRRQDRPRARAGRGGGPRPARVRARRSRHRRAQPGRDQALRRGHPRAHGRRGLRRRLRARRRGHVLHERVRVPHVRHDRHLRGDVGVPARLRRALSVDAAEVDPRQPLRERLRVPARQPADRRGQDPAGALARVPVGRVPGAAPDDEGEPARRQDGRAGRRRARGRGQAGA